MYISEKKKKPELFLFWAPVSNSLNIKRQYCIVGLVAYGSCNNVRMYSLTNTILFVKYSALRDLCGLTLKLAKWKRHGSNKKILI